MCVHEGMSNDWTGDHKIEDFCVGVSIHITRASRIDAITKGHDAPSPPAFPRLANFLTCTAAITLTMHQAFVSTVSFIQPLSPTIALPHCHLVHLHVKGPNMARGGVNSLFKNSTNSLEQEVSK
jgi:hypothetical protein